MEWTHTGCPNKMYTSLNDCNTNNYYDTEKFQNNVNKCKNQSFIENVQIVGHCGLDTADNADRWNPKRS